MTIKAINLNHFSIKLGAFLEKTSVDAAWALDKTKAALAGRLKAIGGNPANYTKRTPALHPDAQAFKAVRSLENRNIKAQQALQRRLDQAGKGDRARLKALAKKRYAQNTAISDVLKEYRG